MKLTTESFGAVTVVHTPEDLTERARGSGDATEAITIQEIPHQGVMTWLTGSGAHADLKLLAGLYGVQEIRKRGGQSHG